MTRRELEKAIADGTPLAVESSVGTSTQPVEIVDLDGGRQTARVRMPKSRTPDHIEFVRFAKITTLASEEYRAQREAEKLRKKTERDERTRRAALALRRYEPEGVNLAHATGHGSVSISVESAEHLLRLLAQLPDQPNTKDQNQ